MKIQLVHNHFDADHLAAVIEEMKVMGAPVIKAVDLGDDRYAALEGSHRIRAAIALGFEPIIEEIDYSDESVESFVPGQFQDEFTIAEIVDSSNESPTAFFDDNPRIIE